MSKNLEITMRQLKKFADMNPLIKDITFSEDKKTILGVYSWGYGTAYTRWDIDDNKKKVRFSIDYGVFCEESFRPQTSCFLSSLSSKSDEIKMMLYSDGRVISEGILSYKNAPLSKSDFDELFIESFFFEKFVDEIRKLSIGGFTFPQEIIERMLSESTPSLLDFDGMDDIDDDLDEIAPSSLSDSPSNIRRTLETSEPPNFKEFFRRMREGENAHVNRDENLIHTEEMIDKAHRSLPTSMPTYDRLGKNENEELIKIIDSKKDIDNNE